MDFGSLFGSNPLSSLGMLGNPMLGMGQQDDGQQFNPIQALLGLSPANTPFRKLALGPVLGGILGGGNGDPKNAPPGTISETGAMPQAQAPQMDNDADQYGGPSDQDHDDVVVTGDSWKPRKPTILGAIADAFLMSHGMQPAFSQNRDARNVNEAMQGFQNNEERSVHRLGMIRGHEMDAYKMQGQIDDDKRADRVQDRLYGTASSKANTALGGFLMAIGNSKDPQANYNRMLPKLREMAKATGATIDLPDNYDPDEIDIWAQGNISPEDYLKMMAINQYRQARLAQGDRRLDQGDTRLGQQQQSITNTQDYRDKRLGQMETTLQERARHNRVTEQQSPHAIPKTIQTPKGPMQLDPSGSKGMLPDGSLWMKSGTAGGKDQWKRVK